MRRRRGEGGSDTGLSSEGGDGQGATSGKDGLGWSSARVGSSSSASSTDQSVLYVQAKDQPWEVEAVANRLKEQLSSTHAHLALDQAQAGGSYDRDEDDREWGIAPLFRMAGPLWHGIAWFNGMISLSWPFEALYVVAVRFFFLIFFFGCVPWQLCRTYEAGQVSATVSRPSPTSPFISRLE